MHVKYSTNGSTSPQYLLIQVYITSPTQAEDYQLTHVHVQSRSLQSMVTCQALSRMVTQRVVSLQSMIIPQALSRMVTARVVSLQCMIIPQALSRMVTARVMSLQSMVTPQALSKLGWLQQEVDMTIFISSMVTTDGQQNTSRLYFPVFIRYKHHFIHYWMVKCLCNLLSGLWFNLTLFHS